MRHSRCAVVIPAPNRTAPYTALGSFNFNFTNALDVTQPYIFDSDCPITAIRAVGHRGHTAARRDISVPNAAVTIAAFSISVW